MGDRQLDRECGVPLYLQLQRLLAEEFHKEGLLVGDMIPTERDLQDRYQVSRATVRSALDVLEQNGVIKRMQGVGTKLARAKIGPNISQLTSFTEDIQAKGMMPGSKTLEVSLVVPPDAVRESFSLADGDKVWYLQRLRLADDEPVGIHNLYIPPTLEFAPQALREMSSYYALLRDRHGIEVATATEIFTAKSAEAQEAELLGTKKGAALLMIQRTTFDDETRPIEYVDLLYRADRYEYTVHLSR